MSTKEPPISETADQGSNLEFENIGSRARAGFGWLAGGRLISQGVQLASSIILARWLVPEDFGLLAMALAVGGIAKAVGDFGVSAVVVQRENVDDSFLSAAFTVNFAVFLAIAVAEVAIAPFGAHLMGEPRLFGVMAGLAFVLPFAGVGSFFQALLRRSLDFRAVVFLSFVTVGINALVASALAILGFGVWSLVVAQVVSAIATAVTAYALFGSWIPVSATAVKTHRRELGHFGKYATGNSLISYVIYNADYLLIGLLLPTSQLGFYFFAFERSRLVSVRILGLVSTVAFPTYSRIQNDGERLRDAYRSVTVTGFALIAPLTVFLAVHARSIVPFLFGGQWEASILLLQILSIAVLLNALSSGVGSVVYAVGRPEITFRVNRWIVFPLVVSYFLGARFGGIVGVAIAVVFAKGAASIIKLLATYRCLRWRAWPILRPSLLILVGSVFAGSVSFTAGVFGSHLPVWAVIIVEGMVFGCAFLASQAAINRDGLRILWQRLLGSRSRELCRRIIPTVVQRAFAFPLGL